MIAERSEACAVFARSEAGIVGHGCLYVFILCLFRVCVALCLGRGLATSCTPVRGVLPSVK
jgi:hypothetical protein